MSARSGHGELIENLGARSGQFPWKDHGGSGRLYMAMIYANWYPDGEEEVRKEIARDTIREMEDLIGHHGLAEQVTLELLFRGARVGSLQLKVVAGDRNGLQGGLVNA